MTTFLYDSFGSITNETVIGVAGTNTIIRHWDNYGRSLGYSLVGLAVPSEPHCQSTLAYDSATGRLASMLAAGSDTPFTWSYLAGSDLKSSLAYPNGMTASWQYDANGRLLQVKNAFPTNTISQYDYAYDAGGRRAQITRSGSAMSETRTDVYGYNIRSELISAAKLVGGDDPGAPQTAYTEYAYEYDDIGNRITSLDLGTNRTYTANCLNQYTQISNLCDSASLREEFHPQFDDDGNQTLIQTATGVWQIQYNGENRPTLWSRVQSNNSDNKTILSMSFDHMGRRVQYLESCGATTNPNKTFIYDDYLQIANFDHSPANLELQAFVWNPAEPVGTRPLVWNRNGASSFYTHDGNKNVSEVFLSNGETIAHYEYAPFGVLTFSIGDYATDNPWRFSSENEDYATAMVYYNYRHYEPINARWIARDPVDTLFSYLYVRNMFSGYDYLGHKGLLPEYTNEQKKKIIESYVAGIKKQLSEGNEEGAARIAYLMYVAMYVGGAEDESLASEFMGLWLSGTMKDKTYTMKADDLKKIISDDKKGPDGEPSVRDALKRDLCPLMKGKGVKNGRFEAAPSSAYVYTDPYYHAIGGFNLKVNADFSSTDCCVYKVVGDWKFSDRYDWHAGKIADVLDVEIADDWALLVQKYRKELAVWLGDSKLDLAHPFDEEGTWNGEVTIDCCDNGKGGNK